MNTNLLILAFGLLASSPALPAGGDPAVQPGHGHHHHGHSPETARQPDLTLVRESYALPSVPVVRMDGKRADFAREIDSGRPTVLNFIYTSCTAVCPMTTQVFSDFQRKLGDERDRVDLVSVSIDPEFDTPPRLAAFARRYGAQPGWQFYTAAPQDSIAIQKALGAYRGDKMNHAPSTYFRAGPGKPWIRLDGLAGPDDLLAVYRDMARER